MLATSFKQEVFPGGAMYQASAREREPPPVLPLPSLSLSICLLSLKKETEKIPQASLAHPLMGPHVCL